tara:strand:+ start:516 stop:632 length:117 start_codon:yes stop_codon:yes gene_type:complete
MSDKNEPNEKKDEKKTEQEILEMQERLRTWYNNLGDCV